MTRKIILLEREALGTIDETYRVAFWLTVPEERRPFYANPAATSVVKDVTQEELGDLRAGRIVEQVTTLNKPQGATEEQAEAMLAGSFLRRQAELQDLNPYDRYGTYWDGEAWHHVKVS